MFRKLAFSLVVSCLAVNLTSTFAQAPANPATKPAAAEAIDFARARELLRKRAAGESLSAADEAFLQRATDAYQAWQALERLSGGDAAAPRRASVSPAMSGKESVGLKPLSEMKAEDRYQGEDGGLYGAGSNTPPAKHLQLATAESKQIQPLGADGKPASDGLIGLISISMSNATQEFSMFKQIADRDPEKSSLVKIVDCAQGGQAMAEWASPAARPWTTASNLLSAAKVSPQQVQVAWIKLANKGPRGNLPEHGKTLQQDTLAVIQNAKAKFPNLRVAYLSSRIYAGYATTPLNPEPYAYESAFVVRWLIQDQIKGSDTLTAGNDATAKAPVLLWGPYLWADGTTPRATDKLVYLREDLANDGTHPSEQGRRKVAQQLLDFFKTDELARVWFRK
ncbi:hypothetical protein ETAA8_69710 [Anatilimnocola aggregata]|uniref:Uncharacterized protein n=1 Tax=Anatilimnocola aggregata TaxID=2528021 RepID=A0A517YNL9_9BACT|nr:hypothetical protein [Anatilimnocola aggregata]QDU31811.1 hypothetical protein ETAA8_69710 [Anatilimnocola aggregata]